MTDFGRARDAAAYAVTLDCARLRGVMLAGARVVAMGVSSGTALARVSGRRS